VSQREQNMVGAVPVVQPVPAAGEFHDGLLRLVKAAEKFFGN